ncbi:ABC-2 type transporter [Hyella patelloides LEGE 07179]|uniref:ABC-2 type transporter n=1 Tax=Hyella patelloides LEGE 07179 TaxID=945734 RepID=A0A563VQ60_9CYAN|nr:ABC transporter permease [Hyella patelloides]VEP13602.1 ABC-2 type transporter [Hyella patelloides LEGE 07179]
MVSNLLAIFQKELQSYFASPLAYIVASIFWLIAGSYMVGMLLGEQGLIQQVAFSDQSGLVSQPIDVAYIFLNSFFSVLGSLCLFILPILSMGLYTEERKRGTLELLATSPIYNWVVALGKLLGIVTFFIFIIAPFLLYEAIIFSAAEPPIPATVPLLAHGGLILFATAILAWGMFISSLTSNNIISAILTFALLLFLWIVDIIAQDIGGVIGENLQHLSLLESYNNLIQGVFELSDLVLLLSYIWLGVFLTAQSVEILRFTRK